MKVATVGTGFITDWFLKAVALHEGITCTAMFSRNIENAKSLQNTYGIPHVYTDYDAMLKQPDIDFVYIASPNSLHYSYSMKALQAGKHVICEKPFTSTVKEFMELYDYATTHKRFLFEAIVTSHMPNYKTIKEHMHRIGTIRMVQCNFSQYSSRYDHFLQGEVPNVFNPAYSGGALADINIYNLHFVTGLFGKAEKVHYFPNKHANGIDTSGVAILEYPNFKAVCVGCKDTKSECITQIQGEKGYIQLTSETSKCSHLTLHLNSGESEDLSIAQKDIALYYELQDFKQCFDQSDYDTCYQQLAYAKEVMETFEAARLDGGVHFTADNT